MRRFAWLLCLVSGCKLQANARYCDPSTACPASFPYCDLTKNECTASADAAVPGDLSASVDDLAGVDASAADAGDAAPDQAPASCTGTADCPSPAPICGGGMCRACAGAADDAECAARSPAAPRCRLSGANAGQCVQCNSGPECPSPSPVCDPGGACAKCAQHGECASGVCILDGAEAGQCAGAFDVAWVDNGGQTIAKCKQAGIHDGAPAHPYCDIADAIASGRPFVRVIGHLGAPYTPLSYTPAGDFSVTIVGPGANAGQPVTLFEANSFSFAVSVSGGVAANVNIVLDGVELGDRATLSNQTGLSCNNGGTGTASITLRRGAVRNQNNTGVSTTNCMLEISDSTISQNNNTGIVAAGAPARLTNNLITANTGTAAVACASNGGTLGEMTLTGNTITGNAGSGVNFVNSNLTASNNTISSNGGAGVACQVSTGGSSTWTGNTITGNTGGGITNNCAMTISSNTITGNGAAGINSANATLVVNNNIVGNNTDFGVEVGAGNLTLDSNVIFGAAGGTYNDGVNVYSGNVFNMTNNLIFQNARNGVTMSMGSTGKFIFNTVVHNGGGGIDCGFNGVAKPIEASIVWGNHQTAGTQFPNTNCELLDTVTGADSFAGARQLDPHFVNPSPLPLPYDYHLKKVDSANAICCYDQVAGPLDGGTSPLPDHDVDGTHRPLGIGYDVGGDEAQ